MARTNNPMHNDPNALADVIARIDKLERMIEVTGKLVASSYTSTTSTSATTVSVTLPTACDYIVVYAPDYFFGGSGSSEYGVSYATRENQTRIANGGNGVCLISTVGAMADIASRLAMISLSGGTNVSVAFASGSIQPARLNIEGYKYPD